MEPASQPFIKICCISSPEEARIALAQNVSALGLVSAMPSGPGVISDAQIARIAAGVPTSVETFLLTCRQTANGIAQQHAVCGTTAIQLVDELPRDELRRLRALLPGVRLMQVIHVTGDAAVVQAQALGDMVDALLLDSGNPALGVKELGGTGRTHDWSLSRRICLAATVPVLLAGGLNAANVPAALRQVGSFGVDVCSGVRTDGRLDADKLMHFLNAARSRPTQPTN